MKLFRKPPSLIGLSKSEQAKLTTAWGADIPLPGIPPNPNQIAELSEFAVEKLREAIEREPHEFVFHYMLIDHLQRTGHLSEAVKAALTARNVAPSDPRATYAVATVFRVLARAIYAAPEYRDRVPAIAASLSLIGQSFDPDASQRALEELGIQLPTAVVAALTSFHQTLKLGVRRDERALVTECITAMRAEFPEYSVWVGAFADAMRRDSTD